jgi:hypothetical protein
MRRKIRTLIVGGMAIGLQTLAAAAAFGQAVERDGDKPFIDLRVVVTADQRYVLPDLNFGIATIEIWNRYPRPMLVEFTAGGALRPRAKSAQVVVESGQTVILGGVMSGETVTAEARTPLIGKLPVPGFLFQERRKANRNILLILQPRLVSSE